MQTVDAVCYTFKGLAKAGPANTYADDEAGAKKVLQERKHMEDNNHMEVRK